MDRARRGPAETDHLSEMEEKHPTDYLFLRRCDYDELLMRQGRVAPEEIAEYILAAWDERSGGAAGAHGNQHLYALADTPIDGPCYLRVADIVRQRARTRKRPR